MENDQCKFFTSNLVTWFFKHRLFRFPFRTPLTSWLVPFWSVWFQAQPHVVLGPEVVVGGSKCPLYQGILAFHSTLHVVDQAQADCLGNCGLLSSLKI